MPLKKRTPVPQVFMTFDTEAYRYPAEFGEEQRLAVGATYDGKNVNYFTSLDGLLKIIGDKIHETDKDVYVFAHNALYDFSLIGLKKFIIMGDNIVTGKGAVFKRQEKFMVENVIWARYDRKYKKAGKTRYQRLFFIDSYQYLHSSLKKLAESFLGEKKYAEEEYNYEWRRWNKYIDSEGMALARDDTIKLHRILQEFFKFLDENGVPFSFSASSIAFAHFRLAFLTKPLYFPNDPAYLDAMLEAYRGGYTNLFAPGKYAFIRDYDVNSLYPDSMKGKKLPVSFVKEIASVTPDGYRALKRKFYVIAKVRFKLPDSERISFIVKNIAGKLYPLKEGSVFLHEPEIDYLLEKGSEVEIGPVYIYKYSTTLFDAYIDFWYKIKKIADAAKNEAKRAMTKLFLNGLYGKMGQHKPHSDFKPKDVPVIYDKPARMMIIEGGKKTVITDYGYFTSTRKDSDPRYSLEIAGAITAYARMKLRFYIERAGIDETIYCDTDSIHTGNERLNEYIGSEIGQLKIEAQGGAVYYAPKVYSVFPSSKLVPVNTAKYLEIHLNEPLGPIIKYKGVNVYKSTQLDAFTWQVKQFSRTKDVAWEGVRVIDRIKTMSFINDKFRWEGGKAYCWTEAEVLSNE